MDRNDSGDLQRVLDPETRMKTITRIGNSVEIEGSIPPRRYYRSGMEMVRMANVYLDEGCLENAYILYMKFMSLFIEKIRTHPDFASVPPSVKNVTTQKLREVVPAAENLKKRLLDHYTKEYERYLKDQERREKLNKERKQLEKEKPKPANLGLNDARVLLSKGLNKYNPSIVPGSTLEGVHYPSEVISLPSGGISENKQNAQLDSIASGPGFDRSTKPLSLLSPSVSQTWKLRLVIIPGNLIKRFLIIAQRNTDKNIETCGILAGKLKQDQLVITHLLIPEQSGTCDSCTTEKEEDLFDYQDHHNLITCGWIHTHPTQTAFLSSVDLHTHYSYQRMMPEAIAIVCAPRYSENAFFCLTPNYGLDFIANCRQTGFHPHPTEPELFMVAEHCKVDINSTAEIVDLRR